MRCGAVSPTPHPSKLQDHPLSSVASVCDLSTHHAVASEKQREKSSWKLCKCSCVAKCQVFWDVAPCHCVLCPEVSKERSAFFKGCLWRLIVWTRRQYFPYERRDTLTQRRPTQTSKSNKFNYFSFNILHDGCHPVHMSRTRPWNHTVVPISVT